MTATAGPARWRYVRPLVFSGEPGAVIRIRGLGSISAGNSPLYVVDGYPLNSADSYNQIPPGAIQPIPILKHLRAGYAGH